MRYTVRGSPRFVVRPLINAAASISSAEATLRMFTRLVFTSPLSRCPYKSDGAPQVHLLLGDPHCSRSFQRSLGPDRRAAFSTMSESMLKWGQVAQWAMGQTTLTSVAGEGLKLH